MSSMRKFAPATSWRIVAALACVALAAGPGLAAGRHAPHHASQPAAQGAGQAGGASTSAGQAKPEGGNAHGSHRYDGGRRRRRRSRPTAAKRRTASRSVRSTSRGRTTATPTCAAAPRGPRSSRAQKKPPVLAPAVRHPHPPAAATAEHARNAAGAAVPAAPALPAAVGAARPEPVHAESVPAFGVAKNNLGLSTTGVHPAPVHVATTPAAPKPPVIGINGTSLHQAGRRYRRTGKGSLGDRRLAIPASMRGMRHA